MRQGYSTLRRLLAGLLLGALGLSAGSVYSQYTVEALGGNAYRYTYNVSGDFLANQALEFQFSAGHYIFLDAGIAPNSDWDGLIFQPNNPPGADGVWSLLALIDNPATSGLFTIDFQWGGPGIPTSQHFYVNQYDALGNFVAMVSQGDTVPAPPGPITVPEPSTAVLLTGAFSAWATARLFRRRRFRSEPATALAVRDSTVDPAQC